jgi:hypothetical protein
VRKWGEFSSAAGRPLQIANAAKPLPGITFRRCREYFPTVAAKRSASPLL